MTFTDLKLAPQHSSGSTENFETLSISECKDVLTKMPPHSETERSVNELIDRWIHDQAQATPIQDLQNILEKMREMPRGIERIHCMNTLVKTLGEPTMLANYLDSLRSSAQRNGSIEQKLSTMSRNANMHCLYGWCGQTLLIHSFQHETPATTLAEKGLEFKLGYTPATWSLSLHIWQPNPRAKGFVVSGKKSEPELLMEPPHSHPFDFVSMISKGSFRQSLYHEVKQNHTNITGKEGRYNGVVLEQVDGIWPPHDHRSSTMLETIENRTLLEAGNSYFLSHNRIHDVEVDLYTAKSMPTITLFLASEAIMEPKAYVSPKLADYHAKHPDLKNSGTALSLEAWNAKLLAVSSYLRGESPTLNLDNIVKYTGEYAFFHS